MDIKEIKSRITHSFFVIFGGGVFAMYGINLIFGKYTFDLHNIIALLVMTVFTDLAYFIFYSNRELNKRQMFIRSIIHFFTIIGIMLTFANFMEWIFWSEPMQVAVFTGSVAAVYIMVWAISEYQTKKLADRMTQKLKERYKG